MTTRHSATGLRQFLDLEQQRDWMEGASDLPDAEERPESLEHRFKYALRFQKLLRQPRAREALEILRRYGQSGLPLPRMTERYYWSVSCLPSTSDKPLVRVSASWMELFTLYADDQDVRSRFIVHLSDFTFDGSLMREQVDDPFLDQCVQTPEDISHFFPRGADIFGINVRGSASIHKCPSSEHLAQIAA